MVQERDQPDKVLQLPGNLLLLSLQKEGVEDPENNLRSLKDPQPQRDHVVDQEEVKTRDHEQFKGRQCLQEKKGPEEDQENGLSKWFMKKKQKKCTMGQQRL